jgi:hypothetical protein
LLQAQSILYRRLSANLYETKRPGEYFHIHGSLEAGKTLNMIGLESHRPDLTEYHECINVIESHVKQFTADELEQMNAREKQAGVTAFKWEEFQKTPHVGVQNTPNIYMPLTILGSNASKPPSMVSNLALNFDTPMSLSRTSS